MPGRFFRDQLVSHDGTRLVEHLLHLAKTPAPISNAQRLVCSRAAVALQVLQETVWNMEDFIQDMRFSEFENPTFAEGYVRALDDLAQCLTRHYYGVKENKFTSETGSS